MAKLGEVKIEEKWHKPPTAVYDDNFGYMVNFYQPMIDYLDKKNLSCQRGHPPHLPWTNERGLEKYRPGHEIAYYPETKLQLLAGEAEYIARQNLSSDFKASKRSDFSLTQMVRASSVGRHIESAKLSDSVKVRKCSDKMKYEKAMSEPYLPPGVKAAVEPYKGRSAKGIETQLLMESYKNICASRQRDTRSSQCRAEHSMQRSIHSSVQHRAEMRERNNLFEDEDKLLKPLDELRYQLKGFDNKATNYFIDNSKQASIEIEQLNARVVEAETKLKTEVTRIKKKYQMVITELEFSLDVANKNNLELQKTIKKQSLQLTELQAHYDEIQRQLAVTLDQYAIATRKLQSLTAELEEIRGNYESALRGKRAAEQMFEESQSRVNELTTINVNLSASRAKLEQELSTIALDYEEVTKELRISDERYQRVQVELKHTVEILHEEQERIIKIDAIKKSLEIEVKNLSVRLEEVEANAIVGGKRIISKLEARMRDLELELDEEKRRHAETIKILRKKERSVKEIMIQSEEDHANIVLLQEALDKVTQKVNIYKRQLNEQEGMSQQSVTRVRRFQRELEAAEDRADSAESNLSLIRAKHRTFVTTSSVPGSQVYLVQESRTTTTSDANY